MAAVLGLLVLLPAIGPAVGQWHPHLAPVGIGTAAAQSIVRGEIEGAVRTPGGSPIADVEVTAIRTDSGLETFFQAARDGSFLLSMLEAGDYDLLVEARGHIPRLVQGVRLRAGQIVRVSITLVPTELPPQRIDTVDAALSGDPRYDGESGRWLRRAELSAFPDPRGGLARIASLAPHLDGSLGSEGLPGTLSRVLLDGIPFTPAVHPMQRGAGDLALFPRSAIANVNVHRRADVEWSGAAGSYIAAASRSAASRTSVEAFGSGSAAALWQSEAVGDTEGTDAGAFWGGASAHLPLDENGTRLLVSGEAMSTSTPRPSPFSLAAAEALVEVRPPGSNVTASELAAPWSSTTRSASGLARLDWRLQDQASVMVRATFATATEESAAFFGNPAVPGAPLPFEGTDLSLGASVMAEAHRLITVEFRGAIERSTREWTGPDGGVAGSTIPTTRWVEDGRLMGGAPGLAGSVERTGFLGSAVGHFRQGPHWVKGGVGFSVASHTFEHLQGSSGEHLLSSPEFITGGGGILRQTSGGLGSRSFTIPELGVFAQYRWEPMRGVRLTSAVRYDQEILPRDRIAPNAEWELLTDIANYDFRDRLAKISPRISVSWDLAGDGATIVEGSMAAQFDRLDPAAFAEVATFSGQAASRLLVGEGSTVFWPGLPSDGGLQAGFRPTLTFFGPQLDAPRTARASAGLTQRIGPMAVLHLGGTFRRTEFLLRRTDLNLAAAPAGTLADGRPVLGTLAQWGAVVGPLPGSNRRFSDFGPVWALTSDGVSEYAAFSAAIEVATPAGVDLYTGYTFSTTEDNLVGAASGIPEASLAPSIPASIASGAWAEGTSDFDVPHRLTAGARVHLNLLQGAEISGVYRMESGRPYTAGYRAGVDVNGDGSFHNDPAFVPSSLPALASAAADCIRQDMGRIAQRNACRGESIHTLDLRLSLGILSVGGAVGSLSVDLFNVLDAEMGRPDSALLLVAPDGTLVRDAATGVTTIPFLVNPEFGEVTHSLRPGRLIRIGFSLELP